MSYNSSQKKELWKKQQFIYNHFWYKNIYKTLTE